MTSQLQNVVRLIKFMTFMAIVNTRTNVSIDSDPEHLLQAKPRFGMSNMSSLILDVI